MESEPTRALELMIGLPDVVFLGVEDEPSGELRVHVEGRSARAFCESCGIAARVKERPVISLIDLPVYSWHSFPWRSRSSCSTPGAGS